MNLKPHTTPLASLSLGAGKAQRVHVRGWRRFISKLDWPLFVVILLLTTIGMFNLYSATANDEREILFFYRQIRWMLIGWTLFVGVTILDYRTLLRISWILFGVALALMIAVYVRVVLQD